MWNLFKTAVAKTGYYAGVGVSFMTLAMVLLMFTSAALSNLFSINFIALQESSTWIHAMVFMLGAAYTLQQNEHVRVDIFYQKYSARTRAWVDLVGTLVFLMPLCIT